MSLMAELKHTIRCKDGGTKEIENYTRALAIKLQCSECLGYGETNPSECTAPLCPLYPFRDYIQLGIKSRSKTEVPIKRKSNNPNAGDVLRKWRADQKAIKESK